MRGIPSSALVFFFLFVILIEAISYLGLWQLMNKLPVRLRRYLNVVYFAFTLIAFGILFYSFSNPEVIRHSRNYTFFYSVVAISILNLLPKSFFALVTIFSLPIRLICGIRKQFIVLIGAALIGLGLILAIAYGIFIGRNQVNVVRQNLYFDDLPNQLEGLKIVQLSDIHLGSFGKDTHVVDETLRKVNALQPDLLLFTGDIVNNFSEEINGFEALLTQFKSKYGKFAILGNHDYGDYYQWSDQKSKAENLKQIEMGLTGSGFKLLLNQWERIVVKDTAFALIGVENWGHKPFPQYADLLTATKDIPSGFFQILMTHDPAHWDAIVVPQTSIPLTLSGHTHGGQFGVKLAGIVFSPMFLIQKKWGGLYESDNQLLYVNTGLGTIGFPGRLEMNPEITLLTLHKTRSH